MVRILIALRRTILRNQLARTNPAMLLTGAGLVFLSALGTIWLGLVTYPKQAAATDVLALVFLLWVGGRVAQSALALAGTALAPRPALAADEVKVGMLRLPTALFVGIDQGYFSAEGIDAKPVFFKSGAELVPALSTGQIDVATTSPGAALFNAMALGINATIVADYDWGEELYRAGGAGGVARPGDRGGHWRVC